MIGLILGLVAVSIVLIVLFPDGGPALVAAWAGGVAVVLADLLLTPGAKKLALEASLPATGFTGLTAPLDLTFSTSDPGLPKNMDLRLDIEKGAALDQRTRRLRPLPGTASFSKRIDLSLSSRGSKKVRSVHLRFPSRLGFFEVLPKWDLNKEINVLPNVQPVLDGTIQTQMQPLMDGMKSVRMYGEGAEFHQLREFVAGMDPRKVDWKRSARMHKLVARETRAERNHQIMVCVDHGHLMAEKIGTLTKLDHGINAALALCWAGVLGGDNIGFYTFGPKPGKLIPPHNGRMALARMRDACAELEQSTSETNHTLGLTHLNGALSRRSLVVVISDFVDSVTAELLVENMALMTRKHLVLYVALKDVTLDQMSRPQTLSMTAIANAIAASQIKRERAAVLDRLHRLGVLCLDADPEDLTPKLISRYIDIKQQELI